METGGGEERSREERRAKSNVGEKICGLTVRENMENKIRDESNGGLESMRRRGGRREGSEDIMQRGDGAMRGEVGKERRGENEGEEEGEGGH